MKTGRAWIVLLIIGIISVSDCQEDVSDSNTAEREEEIIKAQKESSEEQIELGTTKRNEEIKVGIDDFEDKRPEEEPVQQQEQPTLEENSSSNKVPPEDNKEKFEEDTLLSDSSVEHNNDTTETIHEQKEKERIIPESEPAPQEESKEEHNQQTHIHQEHKNSEFTQHPQHHDHVHTQPSNEDSKPSSSKKYLHKIKKAIEKFSITISQQVLHFIPYPFDLVLYTLLGYLFISLFFSSSSSHIQLKKRSISQDQNILLIEKKLKEISYNIQKKKKAQLMPDNPPSNQIEIIEADPYTSSLSQIELKAASINEQFKTSFENHKLACDNLSRFLLEIINKIS